MGILDPPPFPLSPSAKAAFGLTANATLAQQAELRGVIGVASTDSTSASSLAARVPGRNLVISHVGDSNTDNVLGRPGWYTSYNIEFVDNRGPFAGSVNYNIGQNGSTLANWSAKTLVASTSPAPTVRDDPWAAVTAVPDVIILSLGTNDFNNPTARATTGVEATFRFNLDRLINFFLANTKAIIWLRMPAPFANEDFIGTAWVNEAEVIESSRRLRDAYRLWVNRHPRVMLWDSHKALFGNHVSNKATDALDPYGTLPMMADCLHPTDTGFRRSAQSMAEQWSGKWSRPVEVNTLPEELRTGAVGSETVWMKLAASESVMDVMPSADEIINGEITESGSIAFGREVGRGEQVELARLLGRFGAGKRIFNSGGAAGAISMYFHASQRTLRCTTVAFVQTVAGSTRTFEQWSLTGLIDTAGAAATLASGDVGRVTFYWRENRYMPFVSVGGVPPPVLINIPAAQLSAPGVITSPSKAQANPITSINAVKIDGNALTVELRERNQADGRYVHTDGTWTNGKVIATLDFPAGFRRGPTITWNPTDYPTGYKMSIVNSYLTANITAGTVSSGAVQLVVAWM